jgi:hypothetical protein
MCIVTALLTAVSWPEPLTGTPDRAGKYYKSVASVDKTVLRPSLSSFLSFRSSYLGLPIDRVFALLLTHHRSTIDWVRDIDQAAKQLNSTVFVTSLYEIDRMIEDREIKSI